MLPHIFSVYRPIVSLVQQNQANNPVINKTQNSYCILCISTTA